MNTGGIPRLRGFHLRARQPTALLLACMAGLAGLAFKAGLPEHPAPAAPLEPAPLRAGVPGAEAGHGGQAPLLPAGPPPPAARAAEPAAMAVAPAAKPAGAASQADAEPPYRFVGRIAAEEGAASVVLFGRGRVVTLRGPGPVDDEYVVEALSDSHLVLRHTPSGSGSLVALVPQPRPLVSPQDPEHSARD